MGHNQPKPSKTGDRFSLGGHTGAIIGYSVIVERVSSIMTLFRDLDEADMMRATQSGRLGSVLVSAFPCCWGGR